MHLTDRATSLLARLLVEPDLQHGPLILIGHSLGGLVIKQLLRTAESEVRNNAAAASLFWRVTKVAFLATPHAGWFGRLR
jgi:surfactin synthase thioesterase subunit